MRKSSQLHRTVAAGAFFAGLFAGAPAKAVDITAIPGDVVIVNAVNPNRGYVDAMIHAVGLVNRSDQAVTLKGITITATTAKRPVAGQYVAIERALGMSGEFRQMLAQGIDVFARMEFLSDAGLASFLGEDVVLSDDAELAPGEGLIAGQIYLAIPGDIDAVTIAAETTDSGGDTQHSEISIPAARYTPKVAYRMPLNESWFMRSIPGVTSHHRWHASSEFAVDFFKVDDRGRINPGDASQAENYYGYGEPVLAAADGEVVRVLDGAVQDRAARQRREGESGPEYGRRMQQMTMAAMMSDFRRAAAGNLITIRHADGEYASYGHLKPGSIRVAVGDKVEQGQQIAEVGDTGDSPAVHLHFQLNRGPDAFYSMSLPVTFEGIAPYDETGRFVTGPGN